MELKFRVWDKKKKKWMLGYDLPRLGGFSMIGEVMLFGEYTRMLAEYSIADLDDLVITQYTGLNDKNGKEIYDGDIMRGKFGTGIGMASTRYKEFDFSISHHLSSNSSSFGLDMPKNYGNYRFHPNLNQCEVIGNIFERS